MFYYYNVIYWTNCMAGQFRALTPINSSYITGA
jgi:hypothetical protein